MIKSIKKLVLGVALFIASLGTFPALATFAAVSPSVNASSTCEVLSVDLSKFPASQPAQPAVTELSHVEYLWAHKSNHNVQWSATDPGNSWDRAIPYQQRTVIDREAKPAQPAKNNTVKVTIDSASVENTTFSTSFAHDYAFTNKYTTHSYKVEGVAWDNPTHTITKTGNSVPCDDGEVKKIQFCHATASATNPYNYIDTSVNAFFNAGHDTHQNYEDIVPPFTYVKQGQTINFAGLNWNAEGQAIFNNDCNVPITKEAVFSVTTEAATCETGEKLVYGNVANVIVSGTENGSYGPASYEVTAQAVAGAEFDNGETSLTLSGDLNGPLSAAICNATVILGFTDATCEAGQRVTIQSRTNATLTSETTIFEGPNNYAYFFDATGVATFSNGETSLTLSGDLNGPLNCEVPLATATVHIIPATCELGDVLKFDENDVVNASFDETSTASNTEGPISYEVTAYADKGAAFAEGDGVSEDGSTLTFSGELNGPLTGDDCVLGEETPETPVTPTVLPNTNGGATSLITLILGAIVVLVGGIVVRRTAYRGL